jgi:hypothetical protein
LEALISIKSNKEGGFKMEDKTLVCRDCGKEFVHSVRDQEFYKEKGFTNEPVRCKECRDKKKSERNSFRRDQH